MTTTTAALASLKVRLGITSATFDAALAEFLQAAVARLYPLTAYEVDVQTVTPTVDNYGEATVDLSTLATPLLDVRLVEAYDGSTWYPVSFIYRHGTKLRIRSISTSVTSLKLFGLNGFSLGATTPLTTVPSYLDLAVIWFAMSEFFEYLASNKSQYNIYSQTNGARAVDNMRDESAFYEQRAIAYIQENATIYGS